MSKVIVERPRRGGGFTRKGRKPRDSDLLVDHEGMRVPHVRRYNGKQLNENLAPLYRFLHSRLGRRWDDVYSEICENIRVTSTVQEHIRVHIQMMVTTQIWIDDDGEPWDMIGRPSMLGNSAHVKYWVDPRDGLLKKNTAKTWKQIYQARCSEEQAHLDAQRRSLPGGIELRQAGGIWYEVELEPVPPILKKPYRRADGTEHWFETGGSAYDVILGQTVYLNWKLGSPYATTYCKTKRQLSRAELRRYGVAND